MKTFYYILYTVSVFSLGFADVGLNHHFRYYALTALMVLFNAIELWRLYKKKEPFFFFNPICLAVPVTFGLALGGITNWFLMAEGKLKLKEFAGPLANEPEWITVAMTYTALGALMMWIGYHSNVGKNLHKFVMTSLKYEKLFKSPILIQKVIILAIIAYAIKWYLFSIGLYGRLVDERFFEAGVGYKPGSQLRILAPLSLLTFTIITILHFETNRFIFRILFLISLILELFFAFLYGARGPFLIPFLIIFLCYYYVYQKFKVQSLLLIIIPLFLAFSIVLEFKNYSLSDRFQRDSDPFVVFQNFLEYRSSEKKLEENGPGILQSVFDRLLESTSMVQEAALAIRHKDTYGLDETDPDFQKAILLFPYDAFVPKFIQEKNEPTWGYWFKNKVLKYLTFLKYSIALTPVGFLYFAGGPLMVCFGFWIYGVLLRFSYFFLFQGILGFITFLILVGILYNFDSVFSGTMIYVTRQVFIFTPIFFILLCKWTR